MKHYKENPASIRSKKYLTEALLELMEEKSYDKISIKEITDKALLSRRTFYTNFEVKEDILRYHVYSLLNEYIEKLKSYEQLTTYELAKEYFSYWFSHKELLKLLKTNNLLLLIKIFEEFLINMNGIVEITNYHSAESHLQYYEAVFVAGGLWNLVNVWVEENFSKSPEEMTEIFMHIFHRIP